MKQNKKIKVGSLLISEPLLEGDYFRRSVVLVLDSNPKGVMGVLLNKVIDVDINLIVPKLSVKPFNLNSGGPVAENRIFFLHNLPDSISESEKISDGIYWGGSELDIKNYFSNNSFDPKKVKVFLGYSGWDEGQLEQEIKQGSWAILNDYCYDAFQMEAEEMWTALVSKLDRKYHVWLRFPKDSMMN